MIYTLADRSFQAEGDEYYVAPTASVIGGVRLGRWASVWFGAVVRGDSDWIDIGEGSNVQDGAVLHTDSGTVLTVGKLVTIGHMALVHACTVGDDSMIGNGAIVLDNAVIGPGTLIAAGATVPPRKIIPGGVVVMGSPGKVIRDVTEADKVMMRDAVDHYVTNARYFRARLRLASQ